MKVRMICWDILPTGNKLLRQCALVSSIDKPSDNSIDTAEKVLYEFIKLDINDDGVNNDQDTFDEVTVAVATSQVDINTSYLSDRLLDNAWKM